MIAKRLTIGVFILLSSISANAEIKVGSFFIPSYVNNDKSGLFVEFNQHIFPRLGLAYSLD